jgi:hypothetical protein
MMRLGKHSARLPMTIWSAGAGGLAGGDEGRIEHRADGQWFQRVVVTILPAQPQRVRAYAAAKE